MKSGNRWASVAAAVAAVNALGVLLRLYNLDTYIILIGFRFYLSLVLPFFIVFRPSDLPGIKEILLKPVYNKTVQPLLWTLLPFIILLAVLFLLKKADIGDPEYFYEFGLSSIFDLPLYIIWNLPQLLLFFLFIHLALPVEKGKTLFTILTIILLFAFQFIPMNSEKFDLYSVLTLLFAALSSALMLKYFRNVYWFGISFFMLFWLNLLAFGSSSQAMIHILFAAEYSQWEGFFDVSKSFTLFLLPMQALLIMIIIYLDTLFEKKKS